MAMDRAYLTRSPHENWKAWLVQTWILKHDTYGQDRSISASKASEGSERQEPTCLTLTKDGKYLRAVHMITRLSANATFSDHCHHFRPSLEVSMSLNEGRLASKLAIQESRRSFVPSSKPVPSILVTRQRDSNAPTPHRLDNEQRGCHLKMEMLKTLSMFLKITRLRLEH